MTGEEESVSTAPFSRLSDISSGISPYMGTNDTLSIGAPAGRDMPVRRYEPTCEKTNFAEPSEEAVAAERIKARPRAAESSPIPVTTCPV